jgi:predicted metalloprotease with PDZ domain
MTAQSHKELDYNRYIRQAGLSVDVQLQPASIYVGIEFEPSEAGFPRVRRVAANSPAERARLDVGDVLVAMNDERLSFDNFRSRLHSHSIGETVKLTVLRNQRVVNLNIVPVEFQEVRWQLNEMPRATPEQIQLKNSLLGTR